MFLGIDTSNYTTSLALFDGENMFQQKQLLDVKQGERGLRQSDALFKHTVNLPVLFDKISQDINGDIEAVGVSARPRNLEGSYMPCFLAGVASAKSISVVSGVPLYETSHQVGHILAALYSADKLDLINKPFIAFHVSGGTTDALLVTPDENEIIKAELVAQSLDLKAGQAVDRAGVMMGLQFPAGKEIDRLAQNSDKVYKIKPSLKGLDCSLSGVENKCRQMLDKGESKEDIARYCIEYILSALDAMTQLLIDKYGNLPIVFAGGVMSNSIISKKLSEKYGAFFAKPEFSCDNAAGVALSAYLKHSLR